MLQVLGLAVLVAGCGRIGFDAAGTELDAPGPAALVGVLDPDFGSGGVRVGGPADSVAQDVIARGSGYLTGGYRSTAGVTGIELTAFTASGAIDTTYGAAGYSLVGMADYFGYGLLAQPDGGALVIGDGITGGGDDLIVTRVDRDGALVPGFATGGYHTINSATTAADTSRRATQIGSTSYICGTIRYDQPSSEVAIVALEASGARVTAFDMDGVVYETLAALDVGCLDIAGDSSNRIVIAGKRAGSAMVARFTPDGVIDTSFNGIGFVTAGINTIAYGVGVADNDDVIVAGDQSGGGFVLRYTSAGTPVATFGTLGSVFVPTVTLIDLALQPDGKILVAGMRGRAGANTDAVIQRRLADGSLDPTFGVGGEVVIDISPDDELRAIRLMPDGALVAVGYIDTPVRTPWIARIR